MPTKDELEVQLAEMQKQLAEAQAVAAENVELKRKLAVSESDLDKYTSRRAVAAAQAAAGPQPSPSLVRPGLVWDHKKNRAVPIGAETPIGTAAPETPQK